MYMQRAHHKQGGLRTLASVTAPPLASSYVRVKDITHGQYGTLFDPPAFIVMFDVTDPLTKSFYNRFYDLIAIKLLRVTFDKKTNQQVWVPIDGVKMSIGFRDYDCDWPLIAAVPYPNSAIVLFSNDASQCSFDEISFLSEEYKAKIPLELYVKIKGSKPVSIASKSNMKIVF